MSGSAWSRKSTKPTNVEDEFAEDDDDFVPTRPRPLSRSTARTTDRDPRADYRRGESRSRLGFGERDSRRLAEPRTPEPRSSDARTGGDAHPADAQLADSYRDRTEREPWTSRGDNYPESSRGTESRGTENRGAESRGAESRGAESRGAERDAVRPTESVRSTQPPRDESLRSVRQLARPTPSGSQVSYPTQDNLALAPQVQLRERAVVGEEKSRRYQITTLHLTSYSEARTIGEHFRDGFPVIMNLTEMDEPDAKRLVDFAAGLAFALRGSMERVTNRVFLLSPPNIQVSAEDKARIAEGGFFDQD